MNVARIAVAFSMALGSTTAGGGPVTAQTDAIRLSIALPDRPSDGGRVLVQKGCTRCHMLRQRGDAASRIGPSLDRQLVGGTVMDLAGALWNHAPAMFAKMEELKIQPPTMTGRDIAEIVSMLSVFGVPSVTDRRTGDAGAGRRLFAARRCAACHVTDGTLWDGPGPSLQKYRGPASGVFLAQAMWNHSAPMSAAARARGIPWPNVSGREMEDLIAYLRDGGGDTPGVDVYFSPGDLRRGRDLFEQKCGACHGVNGQGGSGAPDLASRAPSPTGSVADVAACMWNHSPAMAAAFERRGLPFATFSGQEMIDVIAYVNFVSFANPRGEPARGRKLYGNRCAVCHANAAALPRFDEPFAIVAAMWNHVPLMGREAGRRGLAWPRFAPGEAADLAAFLVSRPR